MGVGIFFIVVAVFLAAVGVMSIHDEYYDRAFALFLMAALFLITGLSFFWYEPKEHKEKVIECSEYRVVDQKSLTIQDGDTVETVKHFIYYK